MLHSINLTCTRSKEASQYSMYIELPPLPKQIYDRSTKMCMVTVNDVTFPFSITLPLEKDYLNPELEAMPKVDLWNFQSKLRELKILADDEFLCTVQTGLKFKERHKGANVRPDEAAAIKYEWN